MLRFVYHLFKLKAKADYGGIKAVIFIVCPPELDSIRAA